MRKGYVSYPVDYLSHYRGGGGSMSLVTGYLFQATSALATEESLRRKLEAIPGVTLLGDCLVTTSREAEDAAQRITKEFLDGHDH